MLTIDEYRGLGLALREAQTAGDHAKARRIENQLASAPRAIRRIYLGEVPPRRPGDEAAIRPAFLEELLAQVGPIPICDDDFAMLDSSTGLGPRTHVSNAQFGGFRLLERIGVGSLGSVWLAEQTVLCRRAVIKVLDSSFASRPDLVMRLFNEARTVAAIADPGIARIYDVGHHTDGRAYIAMEYLEGESLDQRLSRLGRLPLPDALRIVQQVASTLGVAHQHGIVHRAVKPENIFLARDPQGIGGERAKILDFGIAKLTDAPGAKTYCGTVMEAPAYLSPEQCRGAQHVDQRSDVYALGCMLFALVTGAPPFGRAAVGDTFLMHLFEPPPLLSSRAPRIPPEIDALVQRCLAKDPASRYHSGTELAADIGWILGTPAAARRSAARSASGVPVEHVGSGTTLSVASGAAPTSYPQRPSRNLRFAGIAAVIAGGILAVAVPLARRDPTVSTPPTQPPPSMPPPPAESETVSVATLIRLAEAETAAADFTGAQRDLERAGRRLREAGANNAELDYAFARLYESMSSQTLDPEAKRRLLQQARAAYRRFATTAHGLRVAWAIARGRQIADEIDALTPMLRP